MANLRSKTMAVLAMALAGTLLATPALADKPAHAGGGKPDRQQAGPGERGAHGPLWRLILVALHT